MKKELLSIVLSGHILISNAASKSSISPITYFFMLKDMVAQDRLHYKVEGGEEMRNASYGSQFLELFQDSLHEGFFGGVKWGIAACFYQILYELSGGAVHIIPQFFNYITHVCEITFNALCGRQAGIQVAELSILGQLFYNTMHEYNDRLLAHNADLSFQRSAVIMMCEHLIDYFKRCLNHYVDSGTWTRFAYMAHAIAIYDTKQVVFLINLIVRNLATILTCIHQESMVHEIPRLTRSTLQTFHLLNLLLQPEAGHGGNGVYSAWFSNGDQRNASNNTH